MKKLIATVIILVIQLPLFSQELLRKYKTGSVKLVPQTDYALANDWDHIFRSYYDTLYNKPMGNRKSLVLLPDGSIVVNHAYRDYHTTFTPTGEFKKELTIERGGHKAIKGVINENTLFTELDNRGKMTCTDLQGSYRKTLTLNYSAKEAIALNNGKIAVVGWAIWDKKYRTFVSIVDYATNNEKVVWEEFTDRTCASNCTPLAPRKPFNYRVKLKDGSSISCSTMPYSKRTGRGLPPQIASLGNELLVAIPNTGEVFVYDLQGNLQSKSSINWQNNSISVRELKVIQQKAIDKYKLFLNKGGKTTNENSEGYNQIISEMQDDLLTIKSPLSKPFFSTIIKDSDGNVLFFEIPEEKNENVFHVWIYNQQTHFSTKCTFLCNEYDLNISPSKMVFKDGHIYGLQKRKKAKGNPLRLVKFKLETI